MKGGMDWSSAADHGVSSARIAGLVRAFCARAIIISRSSAFTSGMYSMRPSGMRTTPKCLPSTARSVTCGGGELGGGGAECNDGMQRRAPRLTRRPTAALSKCGGAGARIAPSAARPAPRTLCRTPTATRPPLRDHRHVPSPCLRVRRRSPRETCASLRFPRR